MREMSYDQVTENCLEVFREPETSALGSLEKLMDSPGALMHDPIHHYIMPALLLEQI